MYLAWASVEDAKALMIRGVEKRIVYKRMTMMERLRLCGSIGIERCKVFAENKFVG